MTTLQVLKELKKEKWPELKTGEYNLPLILVAMHKFAELRQYQCTSPVCQHLNIDSKDGLDECLDCGVRNY